MIPNEVWLFFFDKEEKSDRLPEIETSKANSEQFLEFSESSFGTKGAKKFYLVALSFQKCFHIMNIGFYTPNLIDKIADHHDFFAFLLREKAFEVLSSPLFRIVLSNRFAGSG